MDKFTTLFTQRLKVDHPILLAPMGSVAGSELAVAVSNAGGLGMVGVGYGDKDWLTQQLDFVQHATTHPWGVGFISWCLTQALFDLVLSYQPAVLMFSFGDCQPWVKQVDRDTTMVLCQVHSVAEAIQLNQTVQPDFLVLQGTEAGGHGSGQNTLAELIDGVTQALPNTPIIAAGGIADGKTLASALQQGASAVSIGTRYFASTQALAHPTMKQQLLTHSAKDTVRTTVYDIIREIPWPAGYNGRAINSPFISRWQGFEFELAQQIDRYQAAFFQAQQQADPDAVIVWAGEGLDQIDSIKSAQTITDTLIHDALAYFKAN